MVANTDRQRRRLWKCRPTNRDMIAQSPDMRPLCQAHAAPSLRRSVFACADAPDRLPSRPHFCFRRRSTRGRLLKLLWVSPVACPVSGSCREARAGTANDTCGQMCRRTAVFAHPWASLEHQSPIDERCRGTTRCARNTHPPTSFFRTLPHNAVATARAGVSDSGVQCSAGLQYTRQEPLRGECEAASKRAPPRKTTDSTRVCAPQHKLHTIPRRRNEFQSIPRRPPIHSLDSKFGRASDDVGCPGSLRRGERCVRALLRCHPMLCETLRARLPER